MDVMKHIFKGEKHRTFFVVSHCSKEEAVKYANNHFKTNKNNLMCKQGWVKDDELYDQKVDGLKVWYVWVKKRTLKTK